MSYNLFREVVNFANIRSESEIHKCLKLIVEFIIPECEFKISNLKIGPTRMTFVVKFNDGKIEMPILIDFFRKEEETYERIKNNLTTCLQGE